MPEGEKVRGYIPVVNGGQNLPPLVGIGVTDLLNFGGPAVPPSYGTTDKYKTEG